MYKYVMDSDSYICDLVDIFSLDCFQIDCSHQQGLLSGTEARLELGRCLLAKYL